MCALLVVVNAIPNQPIAENIRRSLTFQDFQQSPIGAHLDEFTECVGVSMGVFTGHTINPIREAFLSPSTRGCARLKEALDGKPDQTDNYWRFWHGYQVISRPLLYFFSLRTMRIVVFVCFCVSVFAFYETIRARIGATHAAFALAALLCVSAPVYSSLYLISHTVLWLPAFLGAAWLLRTKYMETQTSNETLMAFFLLLGMATSFLGFMTTPLVMLTIPLLVLYWAGRDRWAESRRPSWRMVTLFCAIWTAGYLGCWAVKWMLVAALSNVDVHREVLSQITLRLSGDRPEMNTTSVLIDSSLMNSFKTSLWEVRYGFVGLLGYLVYSVASAFRAHGRFVATNPFRSMNDALTFGIVFALPLLWIAVVRNHTVVDPWFAPAILYTCFALAFWLVNEALGAQSARCEKAA